MRKLRQAEVSIVLTQQNAVFSAGGKHPIRLVHPLIDEVINEYADVCLVPTKDKRILPFKLPMRIEA